MSTPGQTPPNAAAAFCQQCGRPLQPGEVRQVNNHVFCDSCLAARVEGAPAAGLPPAPGYAPYITHLPNPILAGILGAIPGVGAMYNGQFVKGLVHVLIFIGLITVTTHSGPFGILIGVWVIYQIFDAVQTAHAIRLGLPLPDPLGLNNIGAKLGIGTAQQHPGAYTPPAQPYAAPNAAGVPPAPPAAPVGAVGVAVPYTAADPAAAPPYYPPVPPPPPERKLPVGAVILVALGALFLLGTFDVIGSHVVEHGWPVILIVIGVWLLYRNANRSSGGVQ